MQKQSFIKGATLLALATALGKILSAVFKIPLDRFFLHEEGMAVFNSAYNVYMFFFTMATAGVPLTISRLVASAKSKDEESAILSSSLVLMLSLLGVSGVLIFIFADSITALTAMEESALAFRVMAPALIFCAFTATLRGYFQGKMSMLPVALSQVTDSFGRLLLGFLSAFVLSAQTLAITCGGAISGVPLGALLSATVLLAAFYRSNGKPKFSPSSKIVKQVLFLAIPITLTASLHPVFNLADTVTVAPFLTYIAYPSPQAAFGCLSRAATLYALPASIATAVASGILPAVASSVSVGDRALLKKDSDMAIRLALLISVPCAAGFMAVAEDIIRLLYNSSLNYQTLVFIAPSAVFLSVASVLCCILQGLGKTKASLICAVFAIISKFVLNPVLMYALGVNGAAAATSVSYFVFTLALIICLVKASVSLSFSTLVTKPVICFLLTFATARLLSAFLPIVIVIVITAIVYIIAVFPTRLITPSELNQIFSGQPNTASAHK